MKPVKGFNETDGEPTMKKLLAVAVMSFVVIAASIAPATAETRNYKARGILTDLRLDEVDATDGARYWIRSKTRTHLGITWAKLVLFGVDAPDGTVLTSHAHTGPCVAGSGIAAGPHWQRPGGGVNARDEIWFASPPHTHPEPGKLVVRNGVVRGVSKIKFGVERGEIASFVVHAANGDRLACAEFTL